MDGSLYDRRLGVSFERAAILYNPAAGGGLQLAVQRVDSAAEALRRHVPVVDLFQTTPERRADALARQAVEAGYDLIAPCGGDGTINEAVNGVAGSHVTLLPLPAGTANVLAWETGLPVDPVKAACALPELLRCEVELGVVEFPRDGRSRYFLLMAGAGMDAGAVYRLNVDLKKRVGILAYFASGIGQLFRPLEQLRLRVNGQEIKGTLVVASKSRLYGGKLVLTPHAHLLADEFDVVCFRSNSPIVYTGYMAGVLTRTIRLFRGVTWRRTREVELLPSENPHVYVQVDGELAGRLPASIRMGEARVRVMLPRAYVADRAGRTASG